MVTHQSVWLKNKLGNLQLSRIIEFPNIGAESSISGKLPLYFRKRYHMLIGQVHIGAQVHSQNFGYLCVYAIATVSVVFSFLYRPGYDVKLHPPPLG